MTPPPLNSWTAKSEEEKDAIREQLDRILWHAAFRNSQRSARFLRYVVEHWLLNDSRGEPLKERTLGAELFGLDPAYDTNQYTVVRNAASDVRKRIALYYHEPGHEGEIRIEIPAGSYMPCFHYPSPETETLPEESGAPRGEEGREVAGQLAADLLPRKRLNRPLILIAVVALAVVVGFFGWRYWSSLGSRLADMSELNLFWRPVLKDSPPEPIILVCVEQLPPAAGVGQNVMPVGDAFAVADFARLFGSKDKKFRIAVASAVPAEDIEPATVVLVGGVGNPWTAHVIEGLRFHFSTPSGADSKETVWIEDRKNPSRRDWAPATSPPVSGVVQDFAIVARVMDAKTGRWRVVVAGLDGIATGTAARLLVDANYMTELTRGLPAGWTSKNLEAVIAVPVVNGRAGFPQLVAYEVW